MLTLARGGGGLAGYEEGHPYCLLGLEGCPQRQETTLATCLH